MRARARPSAVMEAHGALDEKLAVVDELFGGVHQLVATSSQLKNSTVLQVQLPKFPGPQAAVFAARGAVAVFVARLDDAVVDGADGHRWCRRCPRSLPGGLRVGRSLRSRRRRRHTRRRLSSDVHAPRAPKRQRNSQRLRTIELTEQGGFAAVSAVKLFRGLARSRCQPRRCAAPPCLTTLEREVSVGVDRAGLQGAPGRPSRCLGCRRYLGARSPVGRP